MRKVLVFTLAYFPFVGGAEIALHEVMTRLKGKYQFQVVTAKMKSLPSFEVMDGIPVFRLGFGIQWLDKLLFLPCAVLFGLFHKADIVFGLLENQAALAARVVAKFQGAKCIINLQSGDTEDYMRQKLGIFYFLYNWVYGKNSAYIVLSNYLKERALQHRVPAQNIRIIPNGVDTKTFSCKKLRRRDKRPSIITVSRLTVKNAVDDVLKAFALVKKEFPKAVLTICGSGEDELKLKHLASELNVAKDVRFTGLVSYKNLPNYLCEADVFVRPSISEGFGNSFIEALACGVPIVGTKVGGIPDFLENGKTGLFCKVRNPEDIAKQIMRLLKERSLAKNIVRNGQKMIKKRYEWNLIAKQFDEVLS